MKRKRGNSKGPNWMDTYGDMVTLLLCFFVLLYSMSTLDQQKWEQIVRSFNPDAIPDVTQIEQGNDGNISDPTGGTASQEEIDADIDQLYESLQEYISQQRAQESISVSRGDGFVFLSLNDAVFFNGDSFDLREDGKTVLNDVGAILAKASESIDELRVLGHTAQATGDSKNVPMPDRMLSTNRANRVLVYLQEEVPSFTLDPARMISVGYGQWRPISSNDTGPERAKNRRVEFIITGKDVENDMKDSIVQYYTTSETTPPPGVFDLEFPSVNQAPDSNTAPPDLPTPAPPTEPGNE